MSAVDEDVTNACYMRLAKTILEHAEKTLERYRRTQKRYLENNVEYLKLVYFFHSAWCETLCDFVGKDYEQYIKQLGFEYKPTTTPRHPLRCVRPAAE